MKAILRAIADPTRREILDMLVVKNEESVKELTKDFHMSLPAISQHLRVLKEAGLIAGRRDGRHILYRLNPAPLFEVARWIHPYERFWKTKLETLAAHLKRRHGKDHH
ncbi:MAG: ArsR/SmtB family transcription factor [Nitrospiria bacterium]